MAYELVMNIILVLEIKIKCAFCNACLVNDVRDGGLAYTLTHKQPESRIKEGISFDLFVGIEFSRIPASFCA